VHGSDPGLLAPAARPEIVGALAGDADQVTDGYHPYRPPAWAYTGAGIMLNVGLRLGTAVVSRPTISSQRRCALSSASIVGIVLVGADLLKRSALVRAKPARRRARVIIGGAACRGRYGPGWQSPVSPYKLGNRLRLATFPPLRNVSPSASANAARTCSVLARSSKPSWSLSADWWPLVVIELAGHTPRAYTITHCSGACCTAQVRMAKKSCIFLPP